MSNSEKFGGIYTIIILSSCAYAAPSASFQNADNINNLRCTLFPKNQ